MLLNIIEKNEKLIDVLDSSFKRSSETVFILSDQIKDYKKQIAKLEKENDRLNKSLENHKKALACKK